MKVVVCGFLMVFDGSFCKKGGDEVQANQNTKPLINNSLQALVHEIAESLADLTLSVYSKYIHYQGFMWPFLVRGGGNVNTWCVVVNG